MSRAILLNPPAEAATNPVQTQFLWPMEKEIQKRQSKRAQQQASEMYHLLSDQMGRELERRADEIKKAMIEKKPLEFSLSKTISPDEIDKTLYMMERIQQAMGRKRRATKTTKRKSKKRSRKNSYFDNPIGMELMLPNPAGKSNVKRRTKKRRKGTRHNPPLRGTSLLYGGAAAAGVYVGSMLLANMLIRKKVLESVATGQASKGKVLAYYGGPAAAKTVIALIMNGGLYFATKNVSERNAVLVGGMIPPVVEIVLAAINIFRNMGKPEEVQKMAKQELSASGQKTAADAPAKGGVTTSSPKKLEAPKKVTSSGSSGKFGSGKKNTDTSTEKRNFQYLSEEELSEEELSDGVGDVGEEELSEEELSDGVGEEELSDGVGEEVLSEEVLSEEELSDGELDEEELSDGELDELQGLADLSDDELARLEAAEGLSKGYYSPLQAFRMGRRVDPYKSIVYQEI